MFDTDQDGTLPETSQSDALDLRVRELPLPSDLRWGTATETYQVEGGASQDGKGQSRWDVCVRTSNLYGL